MGGLAEAVDGILAEIRQKWREAEGQPGMLDSLRSFAAAVDWTVSPRLAASLPHSL